MGIFDSWANKGAAIGFGAQGPTGAGAGYLIGRQFDKPSYEEWASQFGPRPGMPDLSTPAAVKDYEAFAKSSGDSPYAQLARAKQAQQGLQSAGQLQGAVAGTEAGRYAKLMQRGGATSGARERLATQGASDAASAQAGLQGRQLAGNLDISLQDAAAKQQALAELPKFGYMDLQNKLQAYGLANQRYLADVQARQLYEDSNKPKGLLGSVMSIPGDIFG